MSSFLIDGHKKNERGAPPFRCFSFIFYKPTFQGGNAMSTITNGIGNNLAMDSRATFGHISVAKNALVSERTKAVTKSDTKESTVKKTENKPIIQDVSGKELRYNVNEQLDQVVVKVVDPTTNKVIKEIPSTDIQEMRIRVKDALGHFIDETW